MKYTDKMVETGSIWRRMAARLLAFGEAMEMSDAEFQGRRIDAIEQRVRELERHRQEP